EDMMGYVESGDLRAGRIVEQVGEAQVSREEEVAGEQVSRLVAERTVGDQEREVFRCVPGRVAGPHRDVADGDGVAVVQAGGVEGVLPILSALLRVVQVRPGPRPPFPPAG